MRDRPLPNAAFARFGQIVLIVGLVITIAGLLLGFSFLFADRDVWARRFLFTVPIGFLLLFTGVVTVVLSDSRSDER